MRSFRFPEPRRPEHTRIDHGRAPLGRRQPARADIAYRIRFPSVGGNHQTATVRRVTGPDAAGSDGDGELVVEDAPVASGTPTMAER